MRSFFTFLKVLLFPSLVAANSTVLADEAQDRKARSIAILQEEGVKYTDHLPVIETTRTSLRRTEEEVVRRMIALAIVSVKGETGDHAMSQALVRQFRAKGYFSPAEQAFIDNPEPSEHDRNQLTWRYESVHVLLWALGIYDELGKPDTITDVPLLAATLRDLGPDGLRKKARLRPQKEILDAADLIYRYHWAIVNARVTGEPAPASLNASTVYERHYTLNWLIGYMGQDWDDISTDT